jgi:ABC-type nickel/cobalt efflux system permease component RcnA
VNGTLVGLLLGLAMGARHALDPDHLAAVSVLAADAPGARRGALLGALWGLGHAAALLGTGVVLAALAARVPPTLCDAFELGVAAMLILLGARAVRRAVRDGAAGPQRVTRTRKRTFTSRGGRSRCGRSPSAWCTAWPAAAR